MQPTSTQGHWIPGGFPAVPWPSEAGWDSGSLGTQPCSPSPGIKVSPARPHQPPFPGEASEFPQTPLRRQAPCSSQHAGGQGQCGLSSPDTLSPRSMFHLLRAKAKGSVFPGSQGQLNPASLQHEKFKISQKGDIKKNKDTPKIRAPGVAWRRARLGVSYPVLHRPVCLLAAAGGEGRSGGLLPWESRGQGQQGTELPGPCNKGSQGGVQRQCQRGLQRVPEPPLCPWLSQGQPHLCCPASFWVSLSDHRTGAPRGGNRDWVTPCEQCPPGPEPYRCSLCVHPFLSPVGMQGETPYFRISPGGMKPQGQSESQAIAGKQ